MFLRVYFIHAQNSYRPQSGAPLGFMAPRGSGFLVVQPLLSAVGVDPAVPPNRVGGACCIKRLLVLVFFISLSALILCMRLILEGGILENFSPHPHAHALRVWGKMNYNSPCKGQ